MPPFHKYARLGREGDRMPWNGRLFGHGSDHPGFEMVDTQDSFTLSLIKDGSIVLAEPPADAPAKPNEPEHLAETDGASAHV